MKTVCHASEKANSVYKPAGNSLAGRMQIDLNPPVESVAFGQHRPSGTPASGKPQTPNERRTRCWLRIWSETTSRKS